MKEPTFLEIIEADSKRINELTAENEELKKENGSPIECYQSVFGLNSAWPITEVLKKLIEAAEILLNNKNYDGHGWEEIYHATIKAKELEISINNWLADLPLPVASPIECEEIKAGDWVINELGRVHQVKVIEDREGGNKKYWFTTGTFGLKDESSLGNPNNYYKKVEVSLPLPVESGDWKRRFYEWEKIKADTEGVSLEDMVEWIDKNVVKQLKNQSIK